MLRILSRNLERYIFKALKVHQENAKKMPRQLWVYRHGSSDGERDEVCPVHSFSPTTTSDGEGNSGYPRRYQADEFPGAARLRALHRPQWHHVSSQLCFKEDKMLRLLPTNLPPAGERARARDVNVQSGTVLDTGFEKSGVLEFFIKSQESNIVSSLTSLAYLLHFRVPVTCCGSLSWLTTPTCP